MNGGPRFFISHSSGDTDLAAALKARLEALPGVHAYVDASGLAPGAPWERQLHEAMARCNAAVVLLTQAVLAKSDWVLKEAIILAWRRDIGPAFPLFYALGPGVTREQFAQKGFRLAQLDEIQTLPHGLADPARLDQLAAAIAQSLPPQPPSTPYDEIVREVANILKLEDRHGATYASIAQHLGLALPPAWGPDAPQQFADMIATALVTGRVQKLALDGLVNRIGSWTRDRKLALLRLLAPFWIEPDLAAALRLRAPARLQPGAALPAPAGTPAAVTIKGQHVPDFTAEMAVRRAYAMRATDYRLATAVGLGGDLYDEICRALCDYAKQSKWAGIPPGAPQNYVIDKLRTLRDPIFVALDVLPPAETLQQLHDTFPRALFVAPRPEPHTPTGDELTPDPDPTREVEECASWGAALYAIDNG